VCSPSSSRLSPCNAGLGSESRNANAAVLHSNVVFAKKNPPLLGWLNSFVLSVKVLGHHLGCRVLGPTLSCTRRGRLYVMSWIANVNVSHQYFTETGRTWTRWHLIMASAGRSSPVIAIMSGHIHRGQVVCFLLDTIVLRQDFHTLMAAQTFDVDAPSGIWVFAEPEQDAVLGDIESIQRFGGVQS